MNKTKSIVVTVLFLVMLLALCWSLFKLWIPGFHMIEGMFAGCGVVHFASRFFDWLRGDKGGAELQVPCVVGELDSLDKAETYEQIRDELRKES